MGLTETAEKDDSGRPVNFHFSGKTRQPRKDLRELYADRNVDYIANAGNESEKLRLEFRRCLASVGRKGERIELDTIRTGLFGFLCKANPPTGGDSIQAGKDRNLDCIFAAPDVLEISLVGHPVVVQVGKVA